MPCLTHLGSIEIPSKLKDDCLILSRKVASESISGVTNLKRSSRLEQLNELRGQLGLDLNKVDNANLVHAYTYMATSLEMHNDDQLWEKYGVLIMVSVPEGATLIQRTGDSIPLKEGDVLSIRYSLFHGLVMKEDLDRLIFISVDFHVGKNSLNDTWREIIANAG